MKKEKKNKNKRRSEPNDVHKATNAMTSSMHQSRLEHADQPHNQSTMCQNVYNNNTNQPTNQLTETIGKGKGTEIGKWYESWSTNLKGYKYKWNIKLKWISVI